MLDACRLRLGSAAGLAGVTLLAACAGAQSQSGYQEQQQAALYSELLQQQAQAQQAAQSQQAGQAQTATQAQTTAAQAQQPALTAIAAQPVASPASPAAYLPAARIDGQPITSSEVVAHQGATGLARAEALTDLIDVTLLKSAASRHRLPVAPGELNAEDRTELERALADRLDLGWPATTPATTIHAAVRARLLEGKVIEILDMPGAAP